jgi:hypothetical protein
MSRADKGYILRALNDQFKKINSGGFLVAKERKEKDHFSTNRQAGAETESLG